MPNIFSDEIRVNAATANNQFSGRVAQLADGSLFYTYTSLTNSTFEFEDVLGVVASVSSDGSQTLGDPFLLSEGNRNVQGNAVPWVLPTGVFVSYTDAVPISISFTTPGTLLRPLVVTEAGSSFSTPYVLTHDVGAADFRLLSSADNGDIIAMFRQNPPSGSGSETNYIVRGAFNGTSFTFDQPIPLATEFVYGGEDEGDAANYQGNMFVTVWNTSSYGDGMSARVLGYAEDGTPAAGPVAVFAPTQGLGRRTTSVSLDDDIEIERLADGTLVAIYEQKVNSSLLNTDEIAASVLGVNADLSISFGATSLVGGFAKQSDLMALALQDGRLLVAWQTAGEAGLDIYAAIGTPSSGGGLSFETPFLVNQETRGDQSDVSVEQLADGRVVFVYTSSDFGLGDFSGTSVVSRIVDLDDIPGVVFTGGPENDTQSGGLGNDLLNGGEGDDFLYGGNGSDTLIGAGGNDFLQGGASETDLRDIVYGGDGNDTLDGGYGNDELRGDAGNDEIIGGYGVDSIFGGDGNDTLTGQAWSDLIFGGTGDDFINGGFGFDRINGGTGADQFYHLGVEGHGSDWIQDYTAAEGDVLVYGGGEGAAAAGDFLVQRASTPNAGDAAVQEVFITHIPSGNLLWALVDGDAQTEINLQIAGQVYNLLG